MEIYQHLKIMIFAMKLPISFIIFFIGLGVVFFKEFFTKRKLKNNSGMGVITKYGLNTSQDIVSGNTSELWRINVPSQSKLIITHFGNYINEPDAWGLITWRFKRNGVGVYPYSQIEDQLGYPSSLASLDEVEAQGSDLFVIEATNNYGDTVKVGIVLKYRLCGGN